MEKGIDFKSIAYGFVAAIGIAVMLGFSVITKADDRYITRREYDITLAAIRLQLDRIESKLDKQDERRTTEGRTRLRP